MCKEKFNKEIEPSCARSKHIYELFKEVKVILDQLHDRGIASWELKDYCKECMEEWKK